MRVAVIGLGSIGSRHARNLRALGHEVIGFDPVARHDDAWSTTPTIEQALAGADAAVVATPTALHAEHATLALERGVPVLVEKPLAVDAADAERITALARTRSVTCGVAMNLRFHPAIRGLRELLDSGELGEVRYAQVSAGSDLRTWRPGTDYRSSYSARAELGGGIVRDSIHELDYATWLLGPAASATAEVAHVSDLEIDVEDLGLALLRLRSGALVSVDLTYLDPVYRRGCLLVGSLATARWAWTDGTIEVSSPSGAPRVIDVRADVAQTYVAMIRDFIEAAQAGRDPCTTVEEGTAMVGLAAAILRASADGRRVELG